MFLGALKHDSADFLCHATQPLGGKQVSCVEQELSGRQEGRKPDGTSTSVTFKGSELLSNAMPGREVRSSSEWRGAELSGSSKREVLAFHTEKSRDYGKVKIPPLDKRPAIPGGDWGKLHLGAWRMSFTFNIFPKNRNGFGHISRVVGIRPNGTLIIESRSIDGAAKIGAPSYEIQAAGKDASTGGDTASFASGEEEITLGEKPRQMKWQATRHVSKSVSGAQARPNLSLNMNWEPSAAGGMIPPGGVFQSFEYDLTSDSYETHRTCRLSRLLEKDLALNLQGKARSCSGVLSYELEGDEKKYEFESWEIELYSREVPGERVVRLERSVQNRGITYTLTLAWGEHEDRCPQAVDEILLKIKATGPEVGKVLKALDSRITRPEFRAAFLKDLQAIEKRALELHKKHPKRK